MTKRVRSSFVLAPAAVVAGAAAALVHATLLRTDPAADAVVPTPPAAVRLWFSEAVQAAPDPVVVLGPSGARVDRLARVSPDDPTLLGASVVDGGAGTYRVRWRVLSEDGHVIEGDYSFRVAGNGGGNGATIGPAGPGDPGSPGGPVAGGDIAGSGAASAEQLVVQRLLALGRGVHLAGLALALGALAMALVVAPAPPWALRAIAGAGSFGAAVLMIGVPLMLVGQAAALAGSLSLDTLHPAIRETLHTRWAYFWVARTLGSIGLLAVFVQLGRQALSGPALELAGLVAALLLLGGTAANGHALTTDPVWLSLAVDALHLAATAAWLGGGASLALIALRSSSDAAARAGRTALFARAAPRFSRLALVCVEVLIVTGLYQTWAHVASPSLLTATSYGRALLVKVGIFALICAPALYNRRVLKPRLVATSQLDERDRARTIGRFGRTLGLETALGAFVLAAAAVLTTLAPAEAVGAAEAAVSGPAPTAVVAAPVTGATGTDPVAEASAPGRVWSARVGERTVTLALEPGLVGSNRVRVRTGSDAEPGTADAASPRLRAVAPAGSGVAPTTVLLEAAGETYQALLMLAAAGAWTLEVQLADGGTARFEVDVTP